MILLSVFLSHIHTSLNRAYYLSGIIVMKKKKKRTNIDLCRCVCLKKKIRDVHIENLSLFFFFYRVYMSKYYLHIDSVEDYTRS